MQKEHSGQAPRTRSIWGIAALFILGVACLQWAWSEAKGTFAERAVIDVATVGTAVVLINAMTPSAQAIANGSRIRAPGGGINVLNGCEGTEVLFLLVAATLAYPLSWRIRLVGLVGGTALVFVFNQLRLLALFYSYRSDRALFDQLHGMVAPLVLIVVTLGFFLMLMRWDQQFVRGEAVQ